MKFLLIPLFVSQVLAAEVSEVSTSKSKVDDYGIHNYPIDSKYKAGEFLIYNCNKRYFACVDKEGDELCRYERSVSLQQNKGILLCAPLKKFETKLNCIEAYYKLIQSPQKIKFCYPRN